MPEAKSLQSGFSLVEVIVTVFILAMATSFIVVTLPQNPSPLVREAKRLQAFLELATKQSRTGGLPLGLIAEETGYSLAVWRNGEWNHITGTGHTLGHGIRLASYPEDAPDAREVPETWPVAMFDPIGAATALQFELRQDRRQVSVRLREDGSADLDDDNG